MPKVKSGRFHIDRNFHPEFVFGIAPIGTGKRYRLTGSTGDRDPDQFAVSDDTVCWIELDPPRTRHVDLAPGMR